MSKILQIRKRGYLPCHFPTRRLSRTNYFLDAFEAEDLSFDDWGMERSSSSLDLAGNFRFSDFPKKVRDLLKLGGLWHAAVAEAIKAGICDANKLTDLVFYDIRPERELPDGSYRPLEPGEPNFSQLVEEWKALKDFFVLPTLKAYNCGSLNQPQSVTACIASSGGRIRCGNCETREKRLTSGIPTNLLSIPPELRFQGRKGRLSESALRAYQQLLKAARSDGIPEPYLTIISSYRSYDIQASLWRTRLLERFSKLGYSSQNLNCVKSAINKTTKALKARPVPHSKNAWRDRFLAELNKARCSGPGNPGSIVQGLRNTTAPPGRSSHQTGHTVDIAVGHAPGFKTISAKLENVNWQRRHAPFQWMVCNASRFGFYPYIREPWHWEYNP